MRSASGAESLTSRTHQRGRRPRVTQAAPVGSALGSQALTASGICPPRLNGSASMETSEHHANHPGVVRARARAAPRRWLSSPRGTRPASTGSAPDQRLPPHGRLCSRDASRSGPQQAARSHLPSGAATRTARLGLGGPHGVDHRAVRATPPSVGRCPPSQAQTAEAMRLGGAHRLASAALRRALATAAVFPGAVGPQDTCRPGGHKTAAEPPQQHPPRLPASPCGPVQHPMVLGLGACRPPSPHPPGGRHRTSPGRQPRPKAYPWRLAPRAPKSG
jgi:hypothetical protein